ncbi:MAG: YbhB/YbcL family Raf kinase inhibitor-like protein [Caldiserica bacterium]|nr:MAG: YbhB/YbcL family Raf kinase inhibitor-like protein [Caldisericota bacterium]
MKFFILFFLIFSSCKKEERKVERIVIEKKIKRIQVKSEAFNNGEFIPKKYTCDGEDISPPLEWTKVEGSKSYVIVVDDPDAPLKRWIHWIVFNIPPNINSLPEGADKNYLNKIGAKLGLNDFGKLEYGGPCPPGGVHRYYFKVFALREKISAEEGIEEKELMNLIGDYIIGKGELLGKYSR